MSNSDDLAALQKSDQSIWIVYDGDCPFCSAYVKLVRLREIYSNVNLINAREGGAIVDEIKKIPLDLDDGMVLKMGNNFFHGNECMHILASMTTDSGLFNRSIAWIFKSPTRSAYIYPFLKAGRNFILMILGRKKFFAQ